MTWFDRACPAGNPNLTLAGVARAVARCALSDPQPPAPGSRQALHGLEWAVCVLRPVMYTSYIAHRTQIYLDDAQDRQLVDRARQVGRTKSALIRDAIDAYLSPASSEDNALAGLRAAVKDAAGAAPYLPSGVDYVEELRALERERQQLTDRRR